MKIAIIDCFAGISGDMTLGALIDAGVPVDYITGQLKSLKLKDFEIEVAKTQRHHISATKIKVQFNKKEQPERKYLTIKNMIKNSGLKENVKEKSLKAFEILGIAEAKIHDKDINEIHFHEVGAVDSIVDLIGSIVGFDYLGVEKIYGLPVPLGTGFTKTEHGKMPVPSPAAIEILKNYPVIHKTSNFEMTTPTGATILKLLVKDQSLEKLQYKPISVSYGAGSRETDLWPNLLRLIIAEDVSSNSTSDLIMIECNIDDMNPEMYPALLEKLFDAGANDVYLTNIIMKKGRPAIKISVLTAGDLQSTIENILFENTTTIGIRNYSVERTTLPRTNKTIRTKFGDLVVKEIEINGKKLYRPEYEACKKLADENKITLFEVYRIVDRMNSDC